MGGADVAVLAYCNIVVGGADVVVLAYCNIAGCS